MQGLGLAAKYEGAARPELQGREHCGVNSARWYDPAVRADQRDKKRPASRLVLALNGIFWVYFWTYFAIASQPTETAFYMDHPLDPYIFWGHAIGIGMNPLILPFMKVMVCVELPSFFLATLLQNLLAGVPPGGILLNGVLGPYGDKLFYSYPSALGGNLLFGISINGYRLLATMLLSFLQWYFVGWAIQGLWYKCFGRPAATTNQTAG